MFLKVFQSYYGPLLTLFVFSFFVITDRIFIGQVRKLFLVEIAIIISIIVLSWIDYVLKNFEPNKKIRQYRTLLAFLNFSLSPCSPAILILIYIIPFKKQYSKTLLYFIPLILNLALCIVSIPFKFVFFIDNNNAFIRGPFYMFSYIVAFFYIVLLIIYSGKSKKHFKIYETTFLTIVFIIIAGAVFLEIHYHLYFIIWSTTAICAVLYFLELTLQEIIFDPCTSTYSRLFYEKTILKINRKKEITFALIDLNNLKKINDLYGHTAGNKTLVTLAKIFLKNAGKQTQIFRIGGDEFLLMQKGKKSTALEKIIDLSQKECSLLNYNYKISFAYGLEVYTPDKDFSESFSKADKKMYFCKKKMKEMNSTYAYT